MLLRGFNTGKTVEMVDAEFKTCICSSGDEAKKGVDSLVENNEIEMMVGDRVLNVPIVYGRDFHMASSSLDGQCYLKVGKPELCNNSAFMSEARQSFNIHETYDAKLKLCVVDPDWLESQYKTKKP